ncbi:hypothetical protein [Alsobacter sp. R-9]
MTLDLTTLPHAAIAAGVVFFVFWAGLFVGGAMRLGKQADEQAGEVFEHWRGER